MRWTATASAICIAIGLSKTASAQTGTSVHKEGGQIDLQGLSTPVPSLPIIPSAPPPPSIMPPAPPAPPYLAGAVELRDASVYAYSFLDIREDFYTPKVLEQLNRDLTQRFSTINAQLAILDYKQTEIGQYSTDVIGAGPVSGYVPVELVMLRNHARERLAKAKYRLVIFPSSYTVSGSWRFYDILWVLYDAQSGRRLWSYEYSGKHLVLWKNSENFKSRSKKIIDALFVQLAKEKMI